ncbi:MAG TPA: hypothetical protein ENI61_00190 [Ignavibacteria bacterium]|nr:hypothetical protein [Ignavibacteria bacterium]
MEDSGLKFRKSAYPAVEEWFSTSGEFIVATDHSVAAVEIEMTNYTNVVFYEMQMEGTKGQRLKD